MNEDIPGVDRTHVAEWALAQMYRHMILAEREFETYIHNQDIIANSLSGDRTIPRKEDMDKIAGNNQMYVRNAHMYASIFAAMELADDSPYKLKYKQAIEAAAASLRPKQIPVQRNAA